MGKYFFDKGVTRNNGGKKASSINEVLGKLESHMQSMKLDYSLSPGTKN